MKPTLPRLLACGDTAVTVDFGNVVSVPVNRRVHHVAEKLDQMRLTGVVEAVPTYRSLTVHYDPLVLSFDDLQAALDDALSSADTAEGKVAQRWCVPTVFGGAYGEDLEECADLLGLTADSLITAFVAPSYRVMMIGFMPGFSYLAGLPEAIARPRRATPRSRVPKGSVSIGGAQAAVGSVEAPSGWHLLGRTPAIPFLQCRDPMFLFSPGDELRFEPVPARDWDRLTELALRGDPVIRAEPSVASA